jgi:hypothetical protein
MQNERSILHNNLDRHDKPIMEICGCESWTCCLVSIDGASALAFSFYIIVDSRNNIHLYFQPRFGFSVARVPCTRSTSPIKP